MPLQQPVVDTAKRPDPEVGWFCVSTERDRAHVLGMLDPEEQVVTQGIASVSRQPGGSWDWRVGCISADDQHKYKLGPLSGNEPTRIMAMNIVMGILEEHDNAATAASSLQ